jgi:protein arginine kinase
MAAPDPAGPHLPELWLLKAGREQDVVVSTRMRLARNVEGFHFKSRFRTGESERLEVHLRGALKAAQPDLHYVPMHELSATLRELLFERHLVSAEHVNDKHARGVAYSTEGTTSVLVNEEDHLRIQVFAPGLELADLDRRVNEVDDHLGRYVAYEFNERYGYLTSCPTNTGTGLRVSVMLHLPALSFRKETRGGVTQEQGIVKVQKAAQKLGLTVRGTHGESSRAEGDFYQLSNQVTLGRSPGQAVTDLQAVLTHVIEYERNSRNILLKDDRNRLEDVVWRGWAILSHARRISSREALAHLSALRLGVCLGLIDTVSLPALQALMVTMRSGHLQHQAARELQPRERDVLRAQLLRETLTRARG